MKHNCPNINCKISPPSSLNLRSIVKKGYFYRRSDSRRVKRFFCKICKTNFSAATADPRRYQKKRRLTHQLNILFSSGISQRRAALILKVDRKTVVRQFRFLATHGVLKQAAFMERYTRQKLKVIQFDDLETSEHTKCKPLSVSLAVDPIHYKILNFKVSEMPAKGHLAAISQKKYGYRKDKRKAGWHEMFKELKPYVEDHATFSSDDNPHYPKALVQHFPNSTHVTTKGGRGCVTGQGELKKLKFDPIFALNHTCAMLRANLNRLFRKTWCTTKNKKGLEDHLSIFVPYFNSQLRRGGTLRGGSSLV